MGKKYIPTDKGFDSQYGPQNIHLNINVDRISSNGFYKPISRWTILEKSHRNDKPATKVKEAIPTNYYAKQ